MVHIINNGSNGSIQGRLVLRSVIFCNNSCCLDLSSAIPILSNLSLICLVSWIPSIPTFSTPGPPPTPKIPTDEPKMVPLQPQTTRAEKLWLVLTDRLVCVMFLSVSRSHSCNLVIYHIGYKRKLFRYEY